MATTPGFIFGGSTGIASPEELANRRRWAQAMIRSGTERTADNPWEGIANIARALSGNYADYKAREEEERGRAGATGQFRDLVSFMSNNGIPATSSDAPSGARYDATRTAFLDTLAGPESGGDYNKLYGGGKFSSYADHPRQNIPITSGPNKGKTSSGAGKFMFLGSTWDEQRDKLKLPDFSPESQDAAAWDLASSTYHKATGGNLGNDLVNADGDLIRKIAGIVSGKWTSMPGGIEQTVTGDDFLASYNRNLTKQQQVQPTSFNGSANIGITNDAQTPEQQPRNPDGGAIPGVDGRVLDALSNPWMSDAQRGVLQVYFQRQLEAADPRRALELRKLQAEVGNLEDPQMTPAQKAQIDLERDKFAFDKNKPTVIGGESRLVGPDGRVILDAAPPKPQTTDDITEYRYYVEQAKAAGQTPLPFDQYQMAVKKAGASNFNMGGGSDKQIFDALGESANSARAAVTGLAGIREAKKAIAGGAITGAWANERLALQKVGAWLGVADPAKIENTETFRSAIAPQVAAMLKATVGSAQISNSDREFAQQAAGGSITLDERSITRLLDIMERAGTVAVEGHMNRLNKVYPDGKGFDRERAIFGVDMLPPEPSPPPKQRVRIDGNGRVVQ